MVDTNLFSAFLSWQTAIFCLTIYFTTYIVRTIVEAIPASKVKVTKSLPYHLWNEVFLPLGPFGVGLFIALLAKKFPWPMPVADAPSAKMMYGLVCGGASGFVYGRFRAFLRVRSDRRDGPPDSSESPPSVPPPAPPVEPPAPPAAPPAP